MTVKFETTSKLSGINYDISPVSYYETGIELGTFYGCTALTSITLPASLTEIARYSFYGCTALKTIKFSENATLATIGDYGFYECPVLHTVDMSNCNQVTKIGASAFESSNSISVSLRMEGLRFHNRSERINLVLCRDSLAESRQFFYIFAGLRQHYL